MKKAYLVTIFLVILVGISLLLIFSSSISSMTVTADNSGKSTSVNWLDLSFMSVTGDCTGYIYHDRNDNYYPDEDYGPSAHAHVEMELSRIYGEDCSDSPYKEFAKVRVSCEGYSRTQGPLYIYRNAGWDDINCNEYGCTGEDRALSSGTHTITIRDEKGDLDSVTFICYDYDENSGYWSYTWTGRKYYGREVYESHTQKKCSNNDVYWYNSLGNREDRYRDCGSDSCNDWSQNYCENSAVKRKRICYTRGCSSASCYQRSEKKTEAVDSCDEVRHGNNYCSSNDVVRDIEKEGCYNGECIWHSEGQETVEECKYICKEGECTREKPQVSIIDIIDKIIEPIAP